MEMISSLVAYSPNFFVLILRVNNKENLIKGIRRLLIPLKTSFDEQATHLLHERQLFSGRPNTFLGRL